MSDDVRMGIELMPDKLPAKALFILLHGVGATPSDLLPLAGKLKSTFPAAAILIPQAPFPFDGGGGGRQWFSIRGVNEENRPQRVAAAMPSLLVLVEHAQQRFNVSPADTTLGGFSQGAIMALEFSIAHDGSAGRVVAFSGRFAQLPDKAPRYTRIHLLHGEADRVMPAASARAAFNRIAGLNGNITLDISPSAGHEIDAELADCAVRRLQT